MIFYFDTEKKFYCIKEEGSPGCMSEKMGVPTSCHDKQYEKIIDLFVCVEA